MKLGEARRVPARAQPEATPVPGYRLVRPLGYGSSGEVWLADGPGGFASALKFVRLEGGPETVDLRALEILRSIRHPNLLASFGAWVVEDSLVLAMELADGSLWDRFREVIMGGLVGIPRDELLDAMSGVAEGIDYLNEFRHEIGGQRSVGIQHRDLKPRNIMHVGGGVKVADFGAARWMTENTAQHTTLCWTPTYAAPEFFAGMTFRQSDQYSLAATYCHLRGGRPPFVGDPAKVMAGHLQGPPDLTMLPESERPILGRALAKSPKQRWPSCRHFIDALCEATVTERVCEEPVAAPVAWPDPIARKTSAILTLASWASTKTDRLVAGADWLKARSARLMAIGRGWWAKRAVPFASQWARQARLAAGGVYRGGLDLARYKVEETRHVLRDPAKARAATALGVASGLQLAVVLGALVVERFGDGSRRRTLASVVVPNQDLGQKTPTDGSALPPLHPYREVRTESSSLESKGRRLCPAPSLNEGGLERVLDATLARARRAADGPAVFTSQEGSPGLAEPQPPLPQSSLPDPQMLAEEEIIAAATPSSPPLEPQVAPPEPFDIEVPPALAVTAGETIRFDLEVRGGEGQSPVDCTFEDVPGHVHLAPFTIPAGREFAEVALEADRQAGGVGWIRFVARKGGSTAEATVALSVRPLPRPPRITLELSPTLKLEAGATASLPIHVIRANGDNPVEVSFAGLPEGVRVSSVVIPAEAETTTATLSALSDAPASESKIKVLGTSGPARSEVALALTVRLRPAAAARRRAEAELAKGHYEAAVEGFSEAIELEPGDATAFVGRARARARTARWDEALADANEAINLGSKDPEAYLARGRAHLVKGDLDRALSDLETALKARPDDALALIDRGSVYYAKRLYDHALADLGAALKLRPKDPTAWNNRGLTLLALGQPYQAIAALNEAIRLHPEDAFSFYNRGRVYSWLGDQVLALADLDRALKLDPKLVPAYRARADARARAGDIAGSQADRAEADRLQPRATPPAPSPPAPAGYTYPGPTRGPGLIRRFLR